MGFKNIVDGASAPSSSAVFSGDSFGIKPSCDLTEAR